MASPFSYFRKHQQVLMVFLVVASLFAFTLDSLFTAEGANFPFLGMILGAGLLAVLGYRRGRAIEFAVAGALAGGLLGWIMPQFYGTGSGVATNAGTFSQQELQQLVNRRVIANQFLARIQPGSRQPVQFQYGYPELEQEAVMGEILRTEADKMGVTIDDGSVNQFIRRATGDQLTPEQFKAARESIQVGGGRIGELALYDILRSELKAQTALQMMMPFRADDKPTPETYWRMFKRMRVSQEIEATQVPVSSFAEIEKSPTDAQIATLFEEYKDTYPNQSEPGSPGFLQPRKIALAWLEADYESIESSLPDVTDQDVEKFYEENKDQLYKETVLPDLSSDGEEGADADGDDTDGPELESAEPSESSQAESPDNDSTAEDSSTLEGSSEESPESDPPAVLQEDEPADDSCGDAYYQDEAEEQDEPNETTSEDASDETQPTPDAASETEVPATEPAAEAGSDNSAEDDDTGAEPAPTYQPLDEILREEIRSNLLRDQAFAEIQSRCSTAMITVNRLAEDLFFENEGITDADRAKSLRAKMKSYGDENGLAFVETSLLTYAELSDFEEYPVGGATEPGGNQFGNSATVRDIVFGDGAIPLEAAQADDGLSGNRFVYWVTEISEPHVPELAEDGVRDQVIAAWKTQQARPKAKERAEALKTQIEAGLGDEKSLADILGEDTTVTGKEDGMLLTILTPPGFNWMVQNTAQPWMPPQLNRITGIEGVNDAFMASIFEGMDQGEVKVIPNADNSNYYVIHVKHRSHSTEDELAELRSDMLSTDFFQMYFSPYPQLVRNTHLQMNSMWIQKLEEDYAIDWSNLERNE